MLYFKVCCHDYTGVMQLLHKLWTDLSDIYNETEIILEDIQSVVSISLNQTLQNDLNKSTTIWEEIQSAQFAINLLFEQLMAEKNWIIDLQSTSTVIPVLLPTSLAEIDSITLSLQNLDQEIVKTGQKIDALHVMADNLNSSASASSMVLALASTNISAVEAGLEWVLGNIVLLQELVGGEDDSELIGDEVFMTSLQAEIDQLFLDVQLLDKRVNGSLQIIQESITHADSIMNDSYYICK